MRARKCPHSQATTIPEGCKFIRVFEQRGRARLTGPLPVAVMDRSNTESEVKHIVRAATAIAARRKELLLRLRAALKESDLAEAIKLAKELCGLDD